MSITPDERRFKAAKDREKREKDARKKKREHDAKVRREREEQRKKDEAERENKVGKNLDFFKKKAEKDSAPKRADRHRRQKEKEAEKQADEVPIEQEPRKDNTVSGRCNLDKLTAIVTFAYAVGPVCDLIAGMATEYAENVDVLSEDEAGSASAFVAPTVGQWNDLKATLPVLDGLLPLVPQIFRKWRDRE